MQKGQSHTSGSGARGNNVVPLNNVRDFSAATKFKSLEIINRLWISQLSPSEFKIVIFIWQRTVWWNKTSELILLKHFTNGVYDKEKNLVQAGVGLKRRQIMDVIAALLEKGVIIRTPQGPKSFRYSLNLAWSGSMLREPKKKKGENAGLKQPKKAKDGAENRTLGGAENRTYKLGKEKLGNKEESESELSQSVSEKLYSELDRAKKKSLACHEKKNDKRRRRESAADLEALWRDMVKHEHSEVSVAAWTVKQRGKISKIRDIWRAEGNPSFWPFLQFAVANWHRIGTLRFGWMKDVSYPEYPDIDFLLGFRKHFIAAMADETFHERQIGRGEKEREISKFIRMGYTPEQAEQEYENKLERRRKSSADKESARASELARHNEFLERETERLDRELRLEKARRGKSVMDLNRGSNSRVRKRTKKKEMKYDQDGYAIFEE